MVIKKQIVFCNVCTVLWNGLIHAVTKNSDRSPRGVNSASPVDSFFYGDALALTFPY
jgi:hypothetical protein